MRGAAVLQYCSTWYLVRVRDNAVSLFLADFIYVKNTIMMPTRTLKSHSRMHFSSENCGILDIRPIYSLNSLVDMSFAL